MPPKWLVVEILVLAVVGWIGLAPCGVVHPALRSSTQDSTAPVSVASMLSTSTGRGAPNPIGPMLNSSVPTPAPRALQLPRSLSRIPWLGSALHTGPTLDPLTSLPDLYLLEHPLASVSNAVYPGYVAQPAPLGLSDFGLGATTYSYNTTHFLGQVTLLTPPNVTDPGSTRTVDPGGAPLGFVGSLNEFGVQLNTVVSNITYPGSSSGIFWTQNVIDWNDTGIHFIDDTFNFSGSQPFIPSGTIFSGCNNNTSGVDEILAVYGGVFQCVGGTIPLSPVAYPVTLQLYNNASVNADDRDQVAYGYRIVEAGLGETFTGVSDTVVFNNPGAPATPPSTTPAFSVDGFAATPLGLLRDAELDLVGDIGGDNAVFRSINGTLDLEHSNLSVGGWQSVPSAYDFGADTGETSTGIAGYWTPNETEVIHQGPTMLYGLWHAVPSVSVASGALHLAGSITPSYGFVFVSNTAPPANPSVAGTWDNLSWLPTDDLGRFNTYLPPLGRPWTSQYYVQGFADGSAETNGTPVTANTTSYSLSLPRSPGTNEAPLYAFSNGQAAALALNVTGSTSLPYLFTDLRLDLNLSFDHVNDYSYPSFEVAMFEGVSNPLHVNNVTEAANWIDGESEYILDGPASGLLTPAPGFIIAVAQYTSQINVYDGTGDLVTNESLLFTGEIVLWHEVGATVRAFSAESGSEGVFVGDSSRTTVQHGYVDIGVGVQDIGSTDTTVDDLNVSYVGLGVEAYSSRGATYMRINASGGATGAIISGSDTADLAGLNPYYNLGGVADANISRITVTATPPYPGPYYGIWLMDSRNVSISDVNLSGNLSYSVGILLIGTDRTSIEASVLAEDEVGLLLFATHGTNVSGVEFSGNALGAGISGNATSSVVTQSVFFRSAHVGVDIANATGNLVYDDSFILNNGSTFVYDPADVQAYTVPGNSFNLSTVGNCWADWNSSTAGVLNPYRISNGVADEHPIACPGPGAYPVTFSESRLPPGPLSTYGWTVVFDGNRRWATSPTITFSAMPMGTYPVLITGPSGYEATGSGTLTVSGPTSASVTMAMGRTLTLTFAEKGLPRSKGAVQPWCVAVDGAPRCSTTGKAAFLNLTPGLSYVYAVVSPRAGQVITPSTTGIVTLSKSRTVKLAFAYDYEVTFTETGLTSGGWSITVGKVLESRAYDEPIEFNLTNGTHRYRIGPITGFNAIGSPKTVRVSGASVEVTVTFAPKAGHASTIPREVAVASPRMRPDPN